MVQPLARLTIQHVGPTSGGGIATALVSLVSALRAFPDLHVETVASTTRAGIPRKLQVGLQALAQVRRERPASPRIVHLHTASGLSFWRKALLLEAARRAGAYTVLHVHGGAFERFVRETGRFARRRIEQTFASADRVLVVSEVQRLFISERFHRAVELMPNAVHIPEYTPPPSPPPICLVHIGRLGRLKGTWDLLDALGSLPAEGCDWSAVLVGDGDVDEARRRTEALGGRVRVLGWQGSAEITALLRDSHFLVLPSYVEGLPISVLEAMAEGRAVITSPVGGLPELLADRQNGLLVPVGDRAALSRAIVELLESDTLRDRLGAAARETVVRAHDLNAVARRAHALYLELVDHPHGAAC
ncbi:MAG: glycosyltransferase family 4 protein [Candidatus Eisenbacteria bacterium]|nr:glycosyltransferase family 4 protein [Candidatus Eisenbacteria bacterium]MCC7142619.1 glycosyltransferase family 4 protein [Candidatus Eisenbacteria bacterium]